MRHSDTNNNSRAGERAASDGGDNHAGEVLNEDTPLRRLISRPVRPKTGEGHREIEVSRMNAKERKKTSTVGAYDEPAGANSQSFGSSVRHEK